MKIRQTVKRMLVGLVLVAGFSASFATPSSAVSCAGVETSVVGCTQTGACDGGEDPFEGGVPKASEGVPLGTVDDDINADTAYGKYFKEYGHPYGLCNNRVAPNNSVERSGVWGLLVMAIKILTAGVGILAVAGIVYGSVLYASAGGSPEQVKKAMGIISNVVIGIVAYALMYALLNFLIPGGLFD